MAAALAAGLFALPATAAPAPRDMAFFLHYVNATETSRALPGGSSTWTYFDTSTAWNDVNVTFEANGSLQTFDWYLSTPLAGPATFSSGSLQLWTEFVSGVPNAQTTVQVLERAASGAETVVSTSNLGSQSYSSTPSLKALDLALAGPHTFAAGSSIKVSLQVNPGGGVLRVIFDTARADSRLSLNSTSALELLGTTVLDAVGSPTASLDPAASNTTARIQASVQDVFGGYDVAWARATLMAPGGAPVFENATMTRVSGTPVSLNGTFELVWNFGGLAPGAYLVLVFVMDNSGETWYAHFAHFAYGPYGAAASLPLFIGRQPLHNWFEVTDDAGLPLEGAVASFVGATGGGASGTTDAQGRVNLSAAPGNYTLAVVWAATEVARIPLPLFSNVSEDSPTAVRASVFYPSLRIVDSQGAPVGGASVLYTPPNGSALLVPLLTAGDGSVALGRAPGGSYRIVAQWETLVVLDSLVNVDASAATTLSARVFYLDLRVLDSRGLGVAFASLVARDASTGLVLAYNVTDANGSAQARLPASTVDVGAWARDIQVVNRSALAVVADAQVDLAASVFYLTARVEDTGGAAVQGARLTVRSLGGTVTETALTQGSGEATVRLPGAEYALTVEWFGQTLGSNASFVLGSDLNFSFVATLHALRLVITDNAGAPLQGAAVALLAGDGTGTPVAAGLSGADGAVTFAAPAGSFRVAAMWRDVEVLNTTVAVDGDTAVTLRALVGAFEVTVRDREGRALNGVVVSVSNATTGAGLLVAYTGTDGRASFRLPVGGYNLTCKLVATYLLSPIDESEARVVPFDGANASVEVTLAKFPPSLLATNAFALAVLFMAAMVGMAAFVYLRYQRPGRPDGDVDPDEPPIDGRPRA